MYYVKKEIVKPNVLQIMTLFYNFMQVSADLVTFYKKCSIFYTKNL